MVCLRVTVCVLVTRLYAIKTAEPIDTLFLGHAGSRGPKEPCILSLNRHVFSCYVALVWNNLPLPTSSVHNLDFFKSRLKPIYFLGINVSLLPPSDRPRLRFEPCNLPLYARYKYTYVCICMYLSVQCHLEDLNSLMI